MIQVSNLVKTYPNNCKALENVSFSVEPGQVCGYLGANGAGKSTTIKILIGMLSADAGSVTLNGINVFEKPQEVKKIIGYVPESGAVFQSLTPFDFLEFVSRIYEIQKPVYYKRIMEFLEMFDLRNEINTPMSTFSKGMKQKVLIISSLIHNPDIIFWDEPLSGVDLNTNILVRDLVKELSGDEKTFFYSSHVMDMVEKICSKVIILDRGTIVYDNSIDTKTGHLPLEELFRKYVEINTNSVKVSNIYKNPQSN
jgi:ABC-2 type transport system ATP-binding protein